MLCFVINLDSSKERFEAVKTRLSELNVKFERISAVDGRKLSRAQREQITYPLCNKKAYIRFTRTLSPGEIGTFLSHRKCWQMLLDSQEDRAIIMEDDCVLSDRAAQYLQTDSWIPEGVDLLQLHSHLPQVKMHIRKETLSLPTGDLLIAPLDMALGAQCYFISRKAAERAMELSQIFPAPVDDFLFTLKFEIANEFTVWRLQPSVATQSMVESDIGDRRRESQKAAFWVRHGIGRFMLKKRIQFKCLLGRRFISSFK